MGSRAAEHRRPRPTGTARRRKTNKLAGNELKPALNNSTSQRRRHTSVRQAVRRTVATNFLRSDNVNKSRRAARVGARATDRPTDRHRRKAIVSRSPFDRNNSWSYGELLFVSSRRHETDPSVRRCAAATQVGHPPRCNPDKPHTHTHTHRPPHHDANVDVTDNDNAIALLRDSLINIPNSSSPISIYRSPYTPPRLLLSRLFVCLSLFAV